MTIRNRNGEAYLCRLRLIDTPWFGVYLHHVEGPDPQPDPHDHPWTFLSFVVRGGYLEQVWKAVGPLKTQVYSRRWRSLTWHRMRAEGYAHRILSCEPRTVTLILRGPRRREWGFWTISNENREGWTHWKDYEL